MGTPAAMTDPVGAGPGPWSRGEVGRLVGAAAVGAFSLYAFASGRDVPAWFLVLDALLGVAAVAALRCRHQHPVAVATGVVLASAVASSVLGAVLVALTSLATTRRWRPVAVSGVLMLAATATSSAWQEPGDADRLRANLVLAALVWATCTALGAYLGSRRDLVAALRARAEAAERAVGAERDRARFAERTRIAREMHDVLAHRISLVAMHAGVLAFREDLPSAERTQAAGVVRDNANLALLELRQVLGVLRDPAADDAPATAAPPPPQPDLGGLEDLVAQARDAGGDVTLRFEPDGPDLLDRVPATTGRHAYRIVQESLTNARKHAPGATVAVTVAVDGRTLRVVVANGPTSTLRAAPPGSGLGLVGVEERVRQCGGTCTHGPDGAGGYRLQADLPLDEESV